MVDGENSTCGGSIGFPDLDVRLVPPMMNILVNTTPNTNSPILNSPQFANLLLLNYRINIGLEQERQAMIAQAEHETMQMNLAVSRPSRPT